jgi:hypothetical protein
MVPIGAGTGRDWSTPVREYHGCAYEPKTFGRRVLQDLLVRTRIQLGVPIVLV